jgi:hypothetical protein
MKRLLSVLVVVCADASVPGQTACATGPHSKIWYCNAVTGGVVEYPNFRRPGGTVAGDAVWRVFPAEWFLMTGRIESVSNMRLTFGVTNWVRQPAHWSAGVEVRFARRDPSGYLVPDFVRAPLTRLGAPVRYWPPSAGYWKLDPEMGYPLVTGFDPFLEQGLAIVVYGDAGETPASPNLALPAWSQGERYVRAPQPSFSGVRNGATGQLDFLVPPLVPQAAELQFAYGSARAKVQPSASSASDSTDPYETYLGIGAYYNDLASRGGRLRLYSEDGALAGGNGGLICAYGIPLLSLGRGSGTYSVPGSACRMNINLMDPVSRLPIEWGMFGQFQVRDPHTLEVDAFQFTPWIPVPQSSELIGARLHFEVLSVALCAYGTGISSISNSIEIVLR